MWEQFWIRNIHYVLETFLTFALITAGWIYIDGWLIERKIKTLFRASGFFILAVWTILGAAPVPIIRETLSDLIGFAGFIFVLISLLIDPVPVRPGQTSPRIFKKTWIRSLIVFLSLVAGLLTARSIQVFQMPLPLTLLPSAQIFLEPKIWMLILSACITFFLWLHYKSGIQYEWKFFYLGFLFLTLSLIFAGAILWQNSPNVLVANLLAPYHLVWVIEHAIKLISAFALGVWAWGFIRFRVFPQIFSSFIALAFITFILTTIIYTGFMLTRIRASTVGDLETNVKTLQFALEKVKESAILSARITATNPQIREAVRRKDRDALFQNLNALMFENKTDFMLAINTGGEVLIRAEDRDRFGDSLADDSVVWRALDGKSTVTISTRQGVSIPTVSIKAGSPIVDTSESGEPEIIGTIVTGYLLDLAFVDGIKELTNLDITIFANDTSAATTFVISDTGGRLLGVREVDARILNAVLKKGTSYLGSALVLNQPFLAAYIPLKDVENTTIGMFFTGRSQAAILALATETMQISFSISMLLMLLSILPLWLLSRFITYNQSV